MTLYMLDTNICSFAMRLQPTVMERIETAAPSSSLGISAIVYSELVDGVMGPKASPKHAALLADFLECLDMVLPWDRAAADQTAQIRRTLRESGAPIGLNDSAIAGHAIAVGATLVTNNTREFARVTALTLEDWTHELSCRRTSVTVLF